MNLILTIKPQNNLPAINNCSTYSITRLSFIHRIIQMRTCHPRIHQFISKRKVTDFTKAVKIAVTNWLMALNEVITAYTSQLGLVISRIVNHI